MANNWFLIKKWVRGEAVRPIQEISLRMNPLRVDLGEAESGSSEERQWAKRGATNLFEKFLEMKSPRGGSRYNRISLLDWIGNKREYLPYIILRVVL